MLHSWQRWARESRLWIPRDLDGTNRIWLRSDLGTTTTTNGAANTSWTDQASGLVFTQATAGKKPTFTASSTGGKPALTGTIAGDTLLACGTTWSSVLGNTFTIWIVANVTAIPAASDFAKNGGVYGDVALFNSGFNDYVGAPCLQKTGPNAITYFYTSGEADAAAGFTLGTPFLFRGKRSLALTTTYAKVNAGAEDNFVGQSGLGGGAGLMQLFGNGAAGGSVDVAISELIAIPRIASAAEAALVVSYANTRYGLAAAA